MKFKSNADDRFMKDLHQKVSVYLKTQRYGSFATAGYWIKIVLLIGAMAFVYLSLLFSSSGPLLILLFPVLGLLLLLLALNLAHDAAHNSLTRYHGLNAFLFYFSFIVNGMNPYLWRKRHLREHHPFPNIPHRDPDLIEAKGLRYCNQQPYQWYHRFQHVYAPFLYVCYTLFWIFIKDFKRHVSPGCKFSYKTIVLLNVFIKSFYFFYLLLLPLYLMPEFTGYILTGFLLLHAIASLLVVFTFVISHYIHGIENSKIENETILTSWEMHQINSSVDFHANSKLALFLFGGFNCHNAHHLFPAISHIHYPAITKIIEKNMRLHQLKLNKVSFLKGIYLHFVLLRVHALNP